MGVLCSSRAKTHFIMDGILNFNAPINIDLLDRVCDCSVNGTPEEVAEANRVLSEFKNHEAAWQAVDTILESTSRQYTQYFALSVRNGVHYAVYRKR